MLYDGAKRSISPLVYIGEEEMIMDDNDDDDDDRVGNTSCKYPVGSVQPVVAEDSRAPSPHQSSLHQFWGGRDALQQQQQQQQQGQEGSASKPDDAARGIILAYNPRQEMMEAGGQQSSLERYFTTSTGMLSQQQQQARQCVNSGGDPWLREVDGMDMVMV